MLFPTSYYFVLLHYYFPKDVYCAQFDSLISIYYLLFFLLLLLLLLLLVVVVVVV